MTNLLSTKAMLAALRVTQWSARKLDRKVTAETNHAHGAAADAGRYSKSLIAAHAVKALAAIANEARTYHYSRTLPWLDDGSRILPAALHAQYADRMRALRECFETATVKFLGDYPVYVRDARSRLNGMFCEDDYPAADAVARRFGFRVTLLPVPDASDFRVEIGDATAAQIRTEIEATTRDAFQAAMRDAWQRIAECVGHMAAKLRAFKSASAPGDRSEGIFRDSLVENIRELAALLPALNIAVDPALAAIAARVERDLCRHDAATLRESETARAVVADAASAILADVQDYLA